MAPRRTRSDKVFVGNEACSADRRDREMRLVAECWNACRSEPRASAVLVEGDPGTGKTRLAEELLERAKLDGAVTVAVRAVAADAGEPWSGAVGIAEGGLLDGSGVSATDPRAVAALAADTNVLKKTGRIHFVADLAKEYGFTDVDGRYIPRFNPFG